MKIVNTMIPTFIYNQRKYEFICEPGLIADLDSFGLLEDFIRLLYIFDRNRFIWGDYNDRDYTDNYLVYRGFDE